MRCSNFTVRRLSGEALPCQATESQTIAELKHSLSESLGLAPSQLKLSHNNQQLSDETRCLADLPSDSVLDLVVVPGARAVSGSSDKTLRIWDLQQGRCLGTLVGHSDVVLCVDVDFGAQLALSGSADETLRIWDLNTLQCLGILKGHTDAVRTVCADFTLKRAVSGSFDATLRVWDLETASCLGVLEGHYGWVSSLAVDFSRQESLSCSKDSSLRMWDLKKMECLGTLEGHMGWTSSVAADFGMRRAISGSQDGTVRIWDLETRKCLVEFDDHLRTVVAVAADFGLQLALSCSASTLRMWDLATNTCVASRKANCIDSTAVDQDSVTVWDHEADQCDLFNAHAADIVTLSADLSKKRAASGHANGDVRIWNLETWECVSSLAGHSGTVCVVIADFGFGH